MGDFNTKGSDFINLIITSSNNANYSVERRFKKDITIEEFKNKLELLVGCQSQTMKLQVYNKNDDIVCEPNEIDKHLGFYLKHDGMRVHVNHVEQIEDLSIVPKFELSDEVYSKMPVTLKAFLKENKLGIYNEEKVKQIEENKQAELINESKLISSIKVNDRCEVCVVGNPRRRATVMYVGQTKFKSGYWVGVKYDEPLGKNDGSVAGIKYFECPDKYGGFVKPSNIVVGDFPEEDFDLNEL